MDKAVIEALLKLDNSQLATAIQQSTEKTKPLKDSFDGIKSAIAGAFTVGAIVSFGNAIVDNADKLKTEAAQLGTTTDALQVLDKAFRENDSNHEAMTRALDKTRMAQMELLSGDEKMTEAYAKLGIAQKDLAGLSTDQVFALIADKTVHASNQTDAYTAVSDILGKKLVNEVMPALKAVGEEGFDKMAQSAKTSGEIMDAAFIAKVDIYKDKLEGWKKSIMAFAVDTLAHLSNGAKAAWEWSKALWNGDGLAEANARYKASLDKGNADQQAAIDKTIAAQEKAAGDVANISDALTKKQQKDADDVAKARDKAAQESIDAEKRYAEKVEQLRMSQLKGEDLVVELRKKQAALLSVIASFEERGLAASSEAWNAKSDLLDVQKDLAEAEKDAAKGASDSADAAEKAAVPWEKLTVAQVDTLVALEDALKGMSEDQIDEFLSNLNRLVDGLPKKIPDMSALKDLSDFELPTLNSLEAGGFTTALTLFINGLEGLDLSKLKDLGAALQGIAGIAEFKLPTSNNFQAGKFNQMLTSLIMGLPKDMDKLKDLGEIFKNLGSLSPGDYNIKIEVPEQIDLAVPAEFSADISNLTEYTRQICAMKGIIWK